MTNVLVTGAGGPAAISFMKSVEADDILLFVADMDQLASGLYMVPKERRVLLPAGASEDFVDALLQSCIRMKIDVVVPTVDTELIPVALAEKRFAAHGIAILQMGARTLHTCLDKFLLAQACNDSVRVPRTELFDESVDVSTWSFPLVVKPRTGSGSKGVKIIHSAKELEQTEKSPALIIQEFLPGDEYSVDVLANSKGEVVAAVPRERMKIDSGVAVTSRVVLDQELIDAATQVAQTVGVQFVANVQLRRDAHGNPCLLEVNPRFPGTMTLTVASGVNMPSLALRHRLGAPLNDAPSPNAVAMVRYLEDIVLPVQELASLAPA